MRVTQKFVIYGRLPSLNEYVNSCRSNRYGANSMKKKYERMITEFIEYFKIQPVKNYPVHMKITWYEKNNRRDVDNVTFGTKFVLDALVKNGILKDDSRKYITSVSHEVRTDKDTPRIEVEMEEEDGQ